MSDIFWCGPVYFFSAETNVSVFFRLGHCDRCRNISSSHTCVSSHHEFDNKIFCCFQCYDMPLDYCGIKSFAIFHFSQKKKNLHAFFIRLTHLSYVWDFSFFFANVIYCATLMPFIPFLIQLSCTGNLFYVIILKL